MRYQPTGLQPLPWAPHPVVHLFHLRYLFWNSINFVALWSSSNNSECLWVINDLLLSSPEGNLTTGRQCDQTWRNFDTLANCLKYLVFFEGLFSVWTIFKPTLGILCGHWAYFHCTKWPNNGKIIITSDHTDGRSISSVQKQ